MYIYVYIVICQESSEKKNHDYVFATLELRLINIMHHN